MDKPIQQAVSGWRATDRGPGAGFHALHLHRLHSHVLPHGRGTLSLRSSGRSGGVRHAGLLPVVATLVPTLAMYLLRPHQDDGPEPKSWNLPARFQRAFERGFEAMRTGYLRMLETCIRRRGIVRSGVPGPLRRRVSSDPLARPRLLSRHRRRPVQSAFPRQDRNPHRRDRASGRLG